MRIAEIRRDQYLTGKVKRWHTHAGICQSVADHSWGVAFIISQLNPNPSVSLLQAAINHDCAERITGDIPYPSKYQMGYSEMTFFEAREQRSHAELGIRSTAGLGEIDSLWLRFADTYEALLFLTYACTLNDHQKEELLSPIKTRLKHYSKQLGLVVSFDDLITSVTKGEEGKEK